MKLLSPADRKLVKYAMSRMKVPQIWRMTEFFNEVMFRLPAIRQAERHARNGGKVYMYYWTVPSTVRYRGACHAVELAYVFQNPKETIFTGKAADPELTRIVGDMWANFARCGDPSVPELEWQPYTADSRMTAVISLSPYMKSDPLKAQREQLSPILRYMINASYATLDYNVPFVRKAVAVGAAVAATVAAAGVMIVKKSIK